MDYITEEQLDLPGILAESHHPAAGAVVLFSGEVRNNNIGKKVDYIEYESYVPMASKMMDQILEDARQRWNLNIAVAQHRIGKVKISESAVVVITASAHRSEAYASNRYIIDRIKHEVPIWKCEYFEDGTSVWGGNCNCHTETGDLNKHIYESENG